MKVKKFPIQALAFALFIAFLSISCSNNITEAQPEQNTSNKITSTDITVSYRTDGAYPASFASILDNATYKNFRSALPSIQSTCVYKATASHPVEGSEDVVIEGTFSSGNIVTFKGLELGVEWTVKVWLEDTSLSGDDKIIMIDSASKTFSEEDLVLEKVFVLRPVVSQGKGDVGLPLNFTYSASSDEKIKIQKIKVECDNSSWPSVAAISVASGAASSELALTSVPTGNYEVIIKFLNSDNIVIYHEIQTINILKNMKTDTWRNNGVQEGAVDNSGAFTVSDTLIREKSNEVIYVGDTGLGSAPNDTNTGTAYSPFRKLNQALSYIAATGNPDNKKNYIVNICGTQAGHFSIAGSLDEKVSSITLQKSPTQVENAVLDGQNDGTVLFITTTVPITIKGLTITRGNGGGLGSGIFANKCELTLDENTRVTENCSTQTTSGAVTIRGDASINIKSNVYIYDNYNSDAEPKPVNLYLANSKVIKVTGPLKRVVNGAVQNAKIGITSATLPTETTQVQITSGYGYKNGKNAGVVPGRYFRGDRYGVTYNDAGEVILSLSGGDISIDDIDEDISISINKTFVSKDAVSKIITLSAKTEDGTLIPQNQITYSASLTHHGETVSSADDKYFKLTSNQIELKNTLPAGNYGINITAVYKDKKYSSGFDFKIVEPQTSSTRATILPAGTAGSAGTDAQYIYFGEWPQTIKAANVLIDESVRKDQGCVFYYLGSDGAWYVKCKENAQADTYTYSDSTAVSRAAANSYKYFKVEPIKWRVLTENYNGSGKWLVLAENILNSNICFYENISTRTIEGNTIYSTNWEYSRVRAYLNGRSYLTGSGTNTDFSGKGFLQNAFSTEAQSKIATTHVINDADSTTDEAGQLPKAVQYLSNDTEDKIFLLSVREATTTAYGFAGYDTSDNVRAKSETDYALANFLNISDKCWLLRSPMSGNGYRMRYVSNNNKCNGSAFNADTAYCGIVPAMCIEP